MINTKDNIPEIYAAISLIFDAKVDVTSVVTELNNCGIHGIEIRSPKKEAEICFDVAVIKNKHFWELNDALFEMFSKVKHCLSELKNIVKQNHGEVYIDIAFYQYGSCPALIISGENMKNICFLEANISIDPF